MTKINIARSALLSALSFVCRFAERNSKLPVLNCIKFNAGNSKIVITATNLDQSAQTTTDAEIDEAGSFCVQAELFRKMAESTSGLEITITEDGKSVSIACGKQKFSLPALPGSDFPLLPMLESAAGKFFTLDSGTIKRVQKEVAFAVMDPRGAFFLTGVAWNAGHGNISFAATDKRRLSMLSVPCTEEFSLIVPPVDFPDWSGDVLILASELFIRFENAGQIVATKLIEATYPDIKRLYPESAIAILFDRDELATAIKRTSLAQDGNHPSVLLVGRDGAASISVQSASRDASDEVRYQGGDFQIAFDCGLILSILESFEGEMIELGYVSHADTAVIRDPKAETRSALAFPYRDGRLAEYISHREAAE